MLVLLGVLGILGDLGVLGVLENLELLGENVVCLLVDLLESITMVVIIPIIINNPINGIRF